MHYYPLNGVVGELLPIIYDGSNYRLMMLWGRLSDPVEVMQFTGLLDKNGVEIYEGDIVECSVGPSLSLCDNGHLIKKSVSREVKGTMEFEFGGWVVNNGEQILYVSLYCSPATPECISMKVIGNIYESSDLLPPKESPNLLK